MQLDWQPFVRDASFYGVAVILLLAIVMDGKITDVESLFLLIGYVLYIAFMCFNKTILTWLCGSHLGAPEEPLLENVSAEQLLELDEAAAEPPVEEDTTTLS